MQTIIKNELYAAKIEEDLYFGIELIKGGSTSETEWKQYVKLESNALMKIAGSAKRFTGADGAHHFLRVFERVYFHYDTELWVLYASTKMITKKFESRIYYAEQMMEPDEYDDIEMFVTIVTHPKCEFTTHMGIQRTMESQFALHLLDTKKSTKS